MKAFARNSWAVVVLIVSLFASLPAAAQAAYRFDAATVSGLPARNIGSATMSGRIAALDAIEQDGRITVFVGAASGGVWKSGDGGTPLQAGLRPGKRAVDRRGGHRSFQSQDGLGGQW